MRHPLSRFVLWALLAWAFPSFVAAAQDEEAARQRHVWGRHQPGTWSLTRVVRETLDEAGQVTGVSTTRIKTVLQKVDAATFVLRYESETEVAGKVILSEETATKRIDGLPVDGGASSRWDGEDTLLIDGVSYPCRVRRIEDSRPPAKAEMRVLYSERVYPYVLLRESTTKDTETGRMEGEHLMVVVALEMPWHYGSRTLSTAHCKTVERHVMGSKVTVTISSPEVPGGTVSETSKELDSAGRQVCRTTTELIDLHIEAPLPQESRRPEGLLRRLRVFPGGLGPQGWQPFEPPLPWFVPEEGPLLRPGERPGLCLRLPR